MSFVFIMAQVFCLMIMRSGLAAGAAVSSVHQQHHLFIDMGQEACEHPGPTFSVWVSGCGEIGKPRYLASSGVVRLPRTLFFIEQQAKTAVFLPL